MNVIDGDANPLVNLAEALEYYFDQYSEVILENNRLMYAIWKEDEHFFLFNPYGSDTAGWRAWNYTAGFIVTDSLNELVDLLYGVLEYNDPHFSLHFVALDAIEPGKYKSPMEIVVPDERMTKIFQTKFLPITDDDLLKFEKKKPDVIDVEAIGEEEGKEEEDYKGEEREEEEGEGEEGEEEKAEEKMKEKEEDEEGEGKEEEQEEDEIKESELEEDDDLEDPVMVIEESVQPDAPYRLNFALLTSTVKVQEPTEEELNGLHEEVIMEKLKYDHPPPYVMPPKRTLRILQEAKLANRSIPSLVSRFSIDSRLEIKKGVVPVESASTAIVPLLRDTKPSKMIKLPFRKNLHSRLPPIRIVPLRAIDESYIQDEQVDKAIDVKRLERGELEKKEDETLEKLPIVSYAVRPVLISFGPIIKTPVLIMKHLTSPDDRKRKRVSKMIEIIPTVKEELLDMEKLLFKLIFPKFRPDQQDKFSLPPDKEDYDKTEETQKTIISVKEFKKIDLSSSKVDGFKVVDGDTEIIQGNLSLPDRARIEYSYFKPCYFAATLCILAKIIQDVDSFNDSILDRLIFFANMMNQQVGKLQYNGYRTFDKMNVFNTRFNIIPKKITSADLKISASEELDATVNKFLEKYQTGILVLLNCAYAIWTADDRYYVFDPYPCDEKGKANEEGYCCLMRFRDFKSMLDRIKENASETARKPFRLYTVSFAAKEMNRRKRKREEGIKPRAKLQELLEESARHDVKRDVTTPTVESKISTIELAEWVNSDPELDPHRDVAAVGFTPMRHHEASMLEAIVLENDITTPILAPFERPSKIDHEGREETVEERIIPPERIFRYHSFIEIPIDLCIMAWSLIHDPVTWSERTINVLLEAATDYAFDSVLASEDTSVSDMVDAVLPEFEIANYVFRAVFAPIHQGILYATEGWNLAITLEKIFETTIYTGAIIVCGYAHVGITKCGKNYFAWWTVTGTKSLRMIISSNLDEFLKLIVKVIDEPQKIIFVVRAITISHARKMAPDYSDVKGLHEPTMTPSLAEIHRKELPESYDVQAIFKSASLASKPIFVLGTVALRDRDSLSEPLAKRCYFVALLAVVIKRDIVQSPLPGMIDRVLEVAEGLYREFPELKFHAENILRNVPLMNRLFDFRDCALPLVVLTTDSHGRKDFYVQVKRHLKQYFKMYTSGILHFANCCYGFWYSRATNCYYYLDPYQCSARGRKTSANGNACLCIFSSVHQMVKHMRLNQYEGTLGFFLHRIHVNSINTLPLEKFQEDPMWIYVDYQWNFMHSMTRSRKKAKNGDRSDPSRVDQQFWNNYTIEVTGLIYSLWGTIGAYDRQFGERAGKNRAAICVAVLAMQNLCHPSRWSPAILDSAVICGDSYYTESLKSLMQKSSKSENRFGLRTSFRIFPHSWTIDFGTSVCGILYGYRNKLTLTDALTLAFEEARNVIIECNGITLAALVDKDVYYIADPCWIGPPLFARDRGAIYVLRCKNMKILIYAITKMFNTNQRLGVYITPLNLLFDREDFDADLSIMERKILSRSLKKVPGKIEDPGTPILGAVTVPEEDFYIQYQRRLAESGTRDFQLESLQLRHMEPALDPENANNVLMSTKWRLNLDQARSRQRLKLPLEPVETKDDSLTDLHETRISVTDMINAGDRYPRLIEFASDEPPLAIESFDTANERSSIRERNRVDVDERVAEMSRKI